MIFRQKIFANVSKARRVNDGQPGYVWFCHFSTLPSYSNIDTTQIWEILKFTSYHAIQQNHGQHGPTATVVM